MRNTVANNLKFLLKRLRGRSFEPLHIQKFASYKFLFLMSPSKLFASAVVHRQFVRNATFVGLCSYIVFQLGTGYRVAETWEDRVAARIPQHFPSEFAILNLQFPQYLPLLQLLNFIFQICLFNDSKTKWKLKKKQHSSA